MTALEAMARAHYEAYAGHYANEESIPPAWDDLPDSMKAGPLQCMRAALTALRDNGVTEGMISAYYAVPVTLSDEYGGETCYAAAEFRAMLDAALGEG